MYELEKRLMGREGEEGWECVYIGKNGGIIEASEWYGKREKEK